MQSGGGDVDSAVIGIVSEGEAKVGGEAAVLPACVDLVEQVCLCMVLAEGNSGQL